MSALEEAPKLARLGSRIAVLIGWRIPVEPIIAAGLTPVTIVPDLAIATPDADVLLSADESLEIRALVQTIVAGQLGFADIILFAPPFARVSAMMEELRRGDLVPKSIPPTYYFELPIQQGEHNRVFAVERVNGFARRIAAAAGLGNAVPEDRLEDSIAATNKVRRAAAALGATRRGARPISGTDYMEAMVAGDWLAPDTHAARLEKLTLTSRSPTNAARMLVVSSSVLAGSSLHSLIEQEGGLVVGEDDIYGSCFAEGEISERSGAPLDAIASFYFGNPPPQRSSPEAFRRRWYHRALEDESVYAVVLYAQLPIWGWDVPAMRAAAQRHGKRCLTIEHDVRTADGREAARAEIRRFLDLKGD